DRYLLGGSARPDRTRLSRDAPADERRQPGERLRICVVDRDILVEARLVLPCLENLVESCVGVQSDQDGDATLEVLGGLRLLQGLLDAVRPVDGVVVIPVRGDE